MDKVNLGLRVKEVRERNNLTQSQLAEKAGISRNYISSIENGRYSPSVEVSRKIAEVLQIPLLHLLDNRVESMEIRRNKSK